MSETPEFPTFEEFSKIARLSRDCVVTEKIDGTNAQVYVGGDGLVLAGSRNRWLTVDADNFGFARWVAEHEAELRDGLGIGRYGGELVARSSIVTYRRGWFEVGPTIRPGVSR